MVDLSKYADGPCDDHDCHEDYYQEVHLCTLFVGTERHEVDLYQTSDIGFLTDPDEVRRPCGGGTGYAVRDLIYQFMSNVEDMIEGYEKPEYVSKERYALDLVSNPKFNDALLSFLVAFAKHFNIPRKDIFRCIQLAGSLKTVRDSEAYHIADLFYQYRLRA